MDDLESLRIRIQRMEQAFTTISSICRDMLDPVRQRGPTHDEMRRSDPDHQKFRRAYSDLENGLRGHWNSEGYVTDDPEAGNQEEIPDRNTHLDL